MKYLFLGLIVIYQKTLSPDHGVFKVLFPWGFCRFHPTCSEYAFGAIEQLGLWRGAGHSLWRLARCNPLVQPAVNYPPQPRGEF
ncbi:MAG: membrane protein insertion efficiency factor YidD [Candidatus Doudnabacteria bacterium]|nr:membrane protein insertion efficiency factor YidD [Candidatus Doudnabacteria bacterium]